MNRTYRSLMAASWLARAGPLGAQGGPPPAQVEVGEARSEEVAASRWLPGTVVSRNDARIAAEVTGRATWVAEVGTRVDAGGELARLDRRTIELQLQDNDATVKRLEAQLKFQRNQVTRLNQLADTNNAAATQLDEAQSQAEVVTQELRAARIAGEQIQVNLERSSVRAPFPGTVVERLVQPGEFLSPGAAVVRLVDTADKEVRVQAPVSSARFVTDGDTVAVRDDFSQADNSVRTVIPVGDERSRMIEIRVALTGSEWVIGSAVRVSLPTSEVRRLVSIPRDALVLRGSEVFVYRVSADSQAERVDVTTGIGLEDRVEVLGDISPGDQLVVRGAERLRPGQPITISASS
ncbi:MAG: efflux RND transporter periplasmic adaptor subunit [Pseudomonadota bacterium]